MVTGSLQVFGPKNAVIKMQDGTNAAVYCQESPEPYFEDFGRAQLIGGAANVALEREFAQLVAGGDYMVFLTPAGDTRGLYVSRQAPGSFEVRETQGGTGSIGFTYRVVTRRKDIEGRRFARVRDDVGQGLAASRAALGVASGPRGPISPQPFVPQPGPIWPSNPSTPNPAPQAPDRPGAP
jgi:hypothetical protein